jgi:hypothetical protein
VVVHARSSHVPNVERRNLWWEKTCERRRNAFSPYPPNAKIYHEYTLLAHICQGELPSARPAAVLPHAGTGLSGLFLPMPVVFRIPAASTRDHRGFTLCCVQESCRRLLRALLDSYPSPARFSLVSWHVIAETRLKWQEFELSFPLGRNY